jgi:hypothetical protein
VGYAAIIAHFRCFQVTAGGGISLGSGVKLSSGSGIITALIGGFGFGHQLLDRYGFRHL